MTDARPRVLVVDDEPQILRFLRPSLAASGYEVIEARTAQEALRAAATASPDLILLDLGLPDGDGKDVIRAVRQWSEMPIIVLSARDRETEKVDALDLGADDYVNKPVGIAELTARLRAALRHRLRLAGETPVLRIGALTIDVAAHRSEAGGVALKLTPREFALLHLLARHAGKVVTHRQLLAGVWGPAHTEDTQYLRVYIGQLREKLALAPAAPPIETEPGIGYRLRAE